MSQAMPTPEKSTPGMSPETSSGTAPYASDGIRSKRILACVLCHQRKIKCERKFPCSNCIRSGVQCLPTADHPRQRRRRFPERVLLDRLRKYEELLRENDVSFEPLHKDLSKANAAGTAEIGDSDDELSESGGVDHAAFSATWNSERTQTAKDFWHAMDKVFHNSDADNTTFESGQRDIAVKEAWELLFKNNDHLLLGSRKAAIDISTLQPEPAQIFRLWQTYLDNINPLLKVTHTPTLQPRVIQAITNVTNIDANLEALMFSIYCISIMSLSETACQSLFQLSKNYLLTRYQFACQQALFNCRYLQSSDRDCLTALFLYMVSVSMNTDPRSLSSMLGVAMRIAQRMGLHNEAVNAKFSTLEAESRRRLWWSLVLFDTRIGEKADHKTTFLVPTWDCKIPLNSYDSDLWPEMKDAPVTQPKATEAIFVVVRYEMANYIRHSKFFLDFSSPSLKPIAKNSPVSEGSAVITLEQTIENKYLRFCDPENPLHFMTIWTARSQLAKLKLVEHYSRYLSCPTKQTDSQNDTVVSYAIQMLRSDTKLMESPLTKRYDWLLRIYFPLPAYVHILQDLRRRPFSGLADRAWEVISDSYAARLAASDSQDTTGNPLYKFFIGMVLQAWEVRVAALREQGKPLSEPGIISQIKQQMPLDGPENAAGGTSYGSTGLSIDDLDLSMRVDFDTQALFYGINWQAVQGQTEVDMQASVPEQTAMSTHQNQPGWPEGAWDMSGRFS